MATSSGLFSATIYNQSQLAERKHVARYWSINTAATAVPSSAHLSALAITTVAVFGGRGLFEGGVLPAQYCPCVINIKVIRSRSRSWQQKMHLWEFCLRLKSGLIAVVVCCLFLNHYACSYEGLFYICLCFLMFCWLEVELQQSTASNPADRVCLSTSTC